MGALFAFMASNVFRPFAASDRDGNFLVILTVAKVSCAISICDFPSTCARNNRKKSALPSITASTAQFCIVISGR